jgi:hypothetical protein
VHLLGLLRERLHHVCTGAEPLPYPLGPPQGSMRLVLALTLVAEVVAVAAQEIPSRSVQDGDPPTAVRSGADEPWPLSAKVTGGPVKGHGLMNIFPLAPRTAPVTVEEQQSLWPVTPLYCTPNRASLPSSPRPAQGEPSSRLQQALTVEISHISAMAFVCRGLLIEPVSIAAIHAAYVFLPHFLPKSSTKFTGRRIPLEPITRIYSPLG